MLKIDDKAPEFCIKNQDDIEISLKDLKGKWIVLYFYPKDNTPGCTTQACDFTNDIKDFEELDAYVIGVSCDDTKKHRSFIKKYDLKITLLSDIDKKMCNAYGVWQLKKFMGRESKGIVRSTYIINPSGNISYVEEKVSVRKKTKIENKTIEIKHTDIIKEKLKELKRSYK